MILKVLTEISRVIHEQSENSDKDIENIKNTKKIREQKNTIIELKKINR